MRFVFISTMAGYSWGGSEELWSRAALRLRAEGHHVAAAVGWRPQTPEQVAHLVEQGIEVFLQTPPFSSLPARAWRKALARVAPPFGDRELRWLLRQKPDLVCVSNGGNVDGLRFMAMCLDHGLPYVSVMQANSEATWPHDEQAERLIAVYRGAGKAFFVSDRNRVLFETQLGIGLNNAEIVRNPFNVSWEAAPAWPNEANGWKLAGIGRFDPGAKGQDLLLRVLASETWKARPVTLSLFGSGPMEQGLRRLAATLGLAERVRIAGQVSDIVQVWATHHALALTSRYEGLPLVLVEAMLCGRPAIVTDVAGNAEMVEEGVSGFVAAAPTVDLVALAMERAWERRAEWLAMGKAARQRVEALVPKDPVGQFCERLKACARS